MMSRDRIKERCRVPTRELLGLVAGTWLAAFLFPPYLGGDDGSAGGPRAGEIRESVSGLCLDGEGAAAQPGRGPPPKPFAACETGNVCLARGTWNAECIDELCLCPRGTYVGPGGCQFWSLQPSGQGACARRSVGELVTTADMRWRDIDDVEVYNVAGDRLAFDDRAEGKRWLWWNERKRPACVLFASYLRPLCVPSASCLRPACVLTGAQPYVCPICVLFASYWCHASSPGKGLFGNSGKRIVGWAFLKTPPKPQMARIRPRAS
jgi:hypothetical protein